ncbi:MAG: branched-chain amino acid aminotransferase [Chitinophagales bacterium]
MNYPISITKIAETRISKVDFNNLGFGKVFSDHMFIADYKDGVWKDMRIVPFDYLPMHPAMSSIHYGQSIFEGLKARRRANKDIIVFRPDKNLERMNISAHRMAMPEIPEDLFYSAINELLKLDEKWIPDGENSSLYIRPFLFATDEFIGIRRSDWYKFIIFTSPVSSYYSGDVKVYASDKYVRAFPGGTGFAKTAGNYARAIQPVEEINKKGYQQILWLDGVEKKYLQEIGTMNIFVIIDGVVLTPSLDEGTILPGITRDSVLSLLKDWNIPFEVRRVSIDEIADAHNRGALEDAFGAGTAATISPIAVAS